MGMENSCIFTSQVVIASASCIDLMRFRNSGLSKINALCKSPDAAKIYTKGAKTADMVAITRFKIDPLFSISASVVSTLTNLINGA
ncbi:hypothetical protein [Paenibacillus sp. SSG-1]|uniref:hypothetical protein n=1 Tax=Paenibacillus sp. SSG-1 TaxID=1443669 RepID=UPI001C5323D6|nr:hypothetical protein [Paenibacillus sp. SSG-1]